MSAVRSIVVVGSGPVAWIAAAAMLRVFRDRRLEVCVVDSGPARDARVGRWTLPSQRGMHALLGINEAQFMKQTGATFKLATEHLGWQGGSSGFFHAHGDIGTDLNGVPFYKFLQSEMLAGRRERPETFSLAATAAKLGRFARPKGEGAAITAGFTYGFHVDDNAYADFLRAHAQRLGARAASAPLSEVLLAANGHVQGLRLADGSTQAGDYFIDASGPDARLFAAMNSNEREDWSAWLPCDRMWSAFAPALNNPPALTQTVATPSGWSWRAPLAQASMVGHVFSSRFQDESAALTALRAFAPVAGQPVLARFAAGRRRDPWFHNCIALGSAALELEPLDGADLHFAQLGLANLIELFPLDTASSIEAVEYNRVMGECADALRDFTMTHYRVGPQLPGDLWAAARATPAPARLAEKLELYAAIGRINLLDFETFEEMDWAWLLMGSGCNPDCIEMQIRLRLEKLSSQEVAALRTHVQQIAASMPPHMDYVRHQASLAARAG